MHSFKRLKLDKDELDAVVGRARSGPLSEQELAMLEAGGLELARRRSALERCLKP